MTKETVKKIYDEAFKKAISPNVQHGRYIDICVVSKEYLYWSQLINHTTEAWLLDDYSKRMKKAEQELEVLLKEE